MTTGYLAGIAIRAAARAPMTELAAVRVTSAAGLAGDARGRPGQRQVTVLTTEGWAAALAAATLALPWTVRRANLLVTGLDLAGLVAAEIAIGATARLRITGETDPCSRMDEAAPGLRAALLPAWRGGVTCRVVADGLIAVGDPVVLWPADDAARGSVVAARHRRL